MIAACPKCATRYRIDTAKLQPAGARLRCSRCETVFRVRPPAAARPAAEAPAATAPAAGAAAPEAAARGSQAPQPAAPTAPPDPARLVLIADPDVEAAKATAAALEAWGLPTSLAHDGVEAVLAIQRQLPRAVVLEASLPKMFGFQICELVKRNESLRSIHVVLVGVVHARERYRRAPEDLYGADAYLEKPDLPDGLAPILRGFGLRLAGAAPGAVAPAAPPSTPKRVEPAQPPLPPAAPAPPAPARDAAGSAPQPAAAGPAAPAAADPALAPARAEAERLARIIVSDVILYNEEKFTRAVAEGGVADAMEPELAEGRALFRQRIDARVQRERDFLREELVRVARAKGME